MKPEIGLLDKNRDAVVKILNTTLSDEMVLLVKTRNYHWNVTGPQFNDLHKFLDAQYEELNEVVDEVAERVRTLGGMPFGHDGRVPEAVAPEGASGPAPEPQVDARQPAERSRVGHPDAARRPGDLPGHPRRRRHGGLPHEPACSSTRRWRGCCGRSSSRPRATMKKGPAGPFFL